MTDDRKDAIRTAIEGLDDAGYTAGGKPSTDAINAAMGDDADTVTAAERDAVWADMKDADKALEPQGDGPDQTSPDTAADGEEEDGAVVQPTAADPDAGHDLATISPVPGAPPLDGATDSATHPDPVVPAVQPAAQDPAAGHDLATLSSDAAPVSEGARRIKITAAPTAPVQVYIIGRGLTEIPLHVEVEVEPEIVEALMHSDGIQIEEAK